MFQRVLLAAFFLCFVSQVSAQYHTPKANSYLITCSNDTVDGDFNPLVDYCGIYSTSRVNTIKFSYKDGRQGRIYVGRLKGFVNDGQTYSAIVWNQDTIFPFLLCDGKIKLYKEVVCGSVAGGGGKNPHTTFSNVIYYIDTEHETAEVPIAGFKSFIQKYIQADKDLAAKVESKKLKKKDLKKVIQEYNTWYETQPK